MKVQIIYLHFHDCVSIYLYCSSNSKNNKIVIDKIMENVKQVFSPPFEISYLKSIANMFLENKKKQYINNEIKIKSIY
jgi:hypothetical protein